MATEAEAFQRAREQADRVAAQLLPVYQLLDWHWGTPGVASHVPSSQELQNTILFLLRELEDKPDVPDIETGGLRVVRNPRDIAVGMWISDEFYFG